MGEKGAFCLVPSLSSRARTDLPRNGLQPSHPLHQAQTQTFSRSASPSLSQSRHHSATPANSFDPPHPLHTTDQSRSRSLSPSQALPAAPRPVNPLASIPSIYPNEQHPFLKHAATLLENREAEQCGDGEVKEWKIAGEGFVERFKDAVEKVGGLLECVVLSFSALSFLSALLRLTLLRHLPLRRLAGSNSPATPSPFPPFLRTPPKSKRGWRSLRRRGRGWKGGVGWCSAAVVAAVEVGEEVMRRESQGRGGEERR